MNITSAQYIASQMSSSVFSIKAVINGKEVSVPMSPANRHYAEILRQVEAGELTIQDAD